MISEIIIKIKSILSKLIKKSPALISTPTENFEEKNIIECESREGTLKNNFIENTYEINSWQEKIENGIEKIENLPLELKLRIIEEYDKQIANLEQEISVKRKKMESINS